MGWACRTHGVMRNAYKILVGNSEVETALERSRCQWEDNIKIDLKECVWERANYFHLAQVRDSSRAFMKRQ
jgi:hypothetical protein